MQGYIAVTTLVLVVGMVVSRIVMMRRLGIEAMMFGKTHRTDFVIVPFALLFVYIVCSGVLPGLPRLAGPLFVSGAAAWIGAVLCAAGLCLFAYSLISFGKSFRVGIDEDHPGSLVTSGAFALSRNPIYTAFLLVLSGIFLIFPSWILMLYLIAGSWLINRQVLREEKSLRKVYGQAYLSYCGRVRRYL